MSVSEQVYPDLALWHVPPEYKIVSKLGEGGFGKVYLVEHVEGERFALKLFDPVDYGDRANAVLRFVRGAGIMRDKISDGSVVRVSRIFGEGSDEPSFLMEFVPGADLERIVQDPSLLEGA